MLKTIDGFLSLRNAILLLKQATNSLLVSDVFKMLGKLAQPASPFKMRASSPLGKRAPSQSKMNESVGEESKTDKQNRTSSLKRRSTASLKRKSRGTMFAQVKQVETTVELASPTSISMKNSFIIKNADPLFDFYYNQIKKRKNASVSTVIVEPTN